MDHLIALGTNHTMVDPSALGRLCRKEDIESELAKEVAHGVVAGFVVIATCNRREVFIDLASEAQPDLVAWRNWFGGLPNFAEQGMDVVRHLIRVAASLDSMVVGENQILGQVKRAWQDAQEAGHSSSRLDELFRRALQGAHEVRNKTGLGTQPVSVASLGMRHLLDRLRAVRSGDRSRLVVLGAGTMARKAASVVAEQADLEVIFVNRTRAAAEDLAARFGGTALALDEFRADPPVVDGILVAARGDQPLFDVELLDGILGGADGPVDLTVVDLCVPCGVEEAITERPEVHLIDMDELNRVSTANSEQRRVAAEAAAPIVERHVDTLKRRFAQRKLGLGEVRNAHLDLAHSQGEQLLNREFAHLDGAERARLLEKIVELAKAHAHLHLQDIKSKATLLAV